jgi:hypothetical protein
VWRRQNKDCITKQHINFKNLIHRAGTSAKKRGGQVATQVSSSPLGCKKMPIPTTQQYQQLANFPMSSWAYWSVDFDDPNSLEANGADIYPFLLQNRTVMKCQNVFLGINRSEGRLQHQVHLYQNFHTVNHAGDLTLKFYLQELSLPNLLGSFMTDLSDEVNNSAVNVNIYPHHIEILLEQLQILNCNEYKVMCFGTKCFDSLVSGLNLNRQNINILPPNIRTINTLVMLTNGLNVRLNIFGLWHYSCRGGNHRNIIELRKQLIALN